MAAKGKGDKEVDPGDEEVHDIPGESDPEPEDEIAAAFRFLGHEDNPEIRYIIGRWLSGAVAENRRLVVEGRIESVTVTWSIGRGDYQPDKTSGVIKWVPDNLKCDIVIDRPATEIIETDGDLGIVGAVVKRLSRELDLRVEESMSTHLEAVYAVAPKRGKGDAQPKVTETEKTVL